ncbi:unnamed protein product [Phyllotreta striolata]|uniref:G-protein coupled receptors family 1 profile domain-containing protein n=1 Tax=Phyllotreta striolata TaxID=444603 RepID=A0A9P0DM34_PHYSR|nr:unnamed protein product [Phyllotreta striolata]
MPAIVWILYALLTWVSPAMSGDNLTETIAKFEASWPVGDWKRYGFFADGYADIIDEHWMKFPPPNTASYYSMGAIYVLIMVLGVAGNSLVVFLFVKCKSLRTSANTLVINLALSDGLMTMKAPIFIYNAFMRGPALGDKACRLYGFVGGLTGTISIITLSLISFDRYFVIKYPLNRSFSDARVKICLAVTWIYGAIFASIPVLDIGWGKYTYEGYLTSCSFDYLTDSATVKRFIVAFFVAAWAVPLALISFSYINIIRVVANRSASHRDSFRSVKREDDKKQEIKLALIVFTTIILWFVSWTPYAIVALLGVSGQKEWITPLMSMIPAVFCKTASCVNSYVYALSHPKFKTELRKLCCKSNEKTNASKIWTTGMAKNREASINKEEISVTSDSMSTVTFEEATNESMRSLKRQDTVIEMICLRPSFSNRSSSLRKLARRMSSKEKHEEDDRNADVDLVTIGGPGKM